MRPRQVTVVNRMAELWNTRVAVLLEAPCAHLNCRLPAVVETRSTPLTKTSTSSPLKPEPSTVSVPLIVISQVPVSLDSSSSRPQPQRMVAPVGADQLIFRFGPPSPPLPSVAIHASTR